MTLLQNLMNLLNTIKLLEIVVVAVVEVQVALLQYVLRSAPIVAVVVEADFVRMPYLSVSAAKKFFRVKNNAMNIAKNNSDQFFRCDLTSISDNDLKPV